MTAVISRAQLSSAPPSHSIMEDASDTESDPDLDAHLDPDQQQFYQRQQEQAMYYQQHTSQHGSQTDLSGASNRHSKAEGEEEEEVYSDDDSSTASIPDDNINFELTYALHTFLATVEGQASVVKGDSLVLLDDANSYWWLVRVLKTEDVGYIPAENIETPYERLARLNKHRNVDLAMATQQEKQAGAIQGRDRLKGMIKARGKQTDRSGSSEESGSRRVFFAPPTYVDHPGVTWSSDEEGESEDGDDEVEEVDDGMDGREGREGSYEGDEVDRSLEHDRSVSMDMEPDDGVEWANDAAAEDQRRVMAQPKSNNPFARDYLPKESTAGQLVQSSSNSSLGSSTSGHLDPAQAGETKRITVTPSVAQGSNGPLLPSAVQAMNGQRNVSGQSTSSVYSNVSTGSARSGTPTSPQEDGAKKMKKMKKPSKEELGGDGEKRRSKGVLSGLFSRNKDKGKKGISSADPRTSEESIVSGAVEQSPMTIARGSEEAQRQSSDRNAPSGHGLRLQQRDQALQQAYTTKYLSKSNSGDVRAATTSEAAIVAQNAAMRMASLSQSNGKRSSIILSPNPAGPPLLNVIRVFAGDHVKSDASFKTVLLNETTSANDLIRQLMQRFHLHGGAHGEQGYYLTVKDVGGEEMELLSSEKPLAAFQEAVQRWAADDDEPEEALRAMTPTIKRSSVSSISSVVSLSSHPAIAKLGMNDFSDDSTVKIYLHRRRPNSQQIGANGSNLPEPASEFSSYSTQLSAVQESSPGLQSSEWSTTGTPPSKSDVSDSGTASPTTPQAQPRYNPSLTVNTTGQASPERYSSPSARFTVQVLIHPGDLPDGSAFDPASDAIIPRQMVRDRQNAGYPMDSRRRLFVLPRNATVVEAIEQGLDRFGIREGMVDGGDDVGNRGSLTRVAYSLVAYVNGRERHLSPSSKVLDAYPTAPQLKPAERITPEQRRRSRDLSMNAGSASDILDTDPVFVLRRVQQRGPAPGGAMQRQQASNAGSSPRIDGRGPLSPQEIIAAQRAATRAEQKALISAHANTKQGVDVVLPDRGTVRSSRLLVPDGEVVRYSYIDGDGETYDISEILEEEWGKDGTKTSPLLAPAPMLLRTATDSSNYVTAPSTPDPEAQRQLGERPRSQDILQGVLERVGGEPDGRIEERLQRVINKVKNANTGSAKSAPIDASAESGRTTPQGRSLETVPEGRAADMTPRASDRSGSRQANYQQTAASVNRIVSRHRQQPSIASIMSEVSASPAPESIRDQPSTSGSETHFDDRGTGSSTPLTATTSSHPTPPFSGLSVFTRSVSNPSPTPRTPVSYTDDFGIKNLMAMVDVRSRDYKPKKPMTIETDEVEKSLYGEKIAWEGVHSDVRGIFGPVAGRLDRFDRDVDELLASVLKRR